MKKIINGKLYNTETAVELAYSWNGYPQGDFKTQTTWLYRKKTGEFFFHIVGGAMSAAAEYYGGASHGGEKIIPTSEAEAREFCEKNLDVDEYIKIFGDVEE